MSAYVDGAVRPDLTERQVRVEEEQALTNRLYALTEFLKIRPVFPQQDGFTDETCFKAWRDAWIHSNDAAAEIAESSLGWASEDRKPTLEK